MPAREGWLLVNPVLPPSGRPDGDLLTVQRFVVDALLELGLLHDDGAVAQQQQLPRPRLVALPVVFGDWHGVLGGGRVAVNAPCANTGRRRPFARVEFTFIFSLPRVCSTLGLMSSPSEEQNKLVGVFWL